MTVRDALSEGREALADRDTDTPALDAALLLAHALGISRARLYMELGDPVQIRSLEEYRVALNRRAEGEPVAWIVGSKEFWGLKFTVGPGVLCPRPDSEVLIEEALAAMDRLNPDGREPTEPGRERFRLHDCCCGPGTLGLALAAERPGWTVSASDISPDAQRFFEENNRTIAGGTVDYHHADLMEGVDGPFHVIVSNPPYLTPMETRDRKALGWKEPALALDGGDDDGLAVIRRLIPRIFHRLRPGGWAFIEADPLQMPIIEEILIGTGFRDIRIRKDWGNRDRVAIARRRGGP